MRVLFVYHVLPGDARPSALRVGHVIGGLRRLGVEHHVLALRHSKTGRVAPSEESADDVTVVPVRSMRNTTLASALFSSDGGFETHIVRDPDVAKAVQAGLGIVERFRPDLVFSYVPPIRTSEVAFQIAARTGVRWVMDWRDPLSFSPLRCWPSRGFHEALQRREDEWLARASALVTNAPALAAELERKCPSKKAAVILTGWDPALIPDPGSEVARGTLLCSGSVEGCSYGLSERFPERFRDRFLNCISHGRLWFVPDAERIEYKPWGLAALRAIARCGDAVAGLLFRGGKPRKDARRTLRRLGLWEKTQILPWIAPAEVWRETTRSHVLWLSRGGVTRTLGEPVLAVKVFGYLRSGRPIVAAVPPDSDTARFLRGMPGAFVPDPGDERALEEAFREALALPPERTFERDIDEYRSDRQIERLFHVLEGVAGGRR